MNSRKSFDFEFKKFKESYVIWNSVWHLLPHRQLGWIRVPMKITKNFTLQELKHSDTARAYGIPNNPNGKQFENLVHLTKDLLQLIRDEIGPIKINSAFRSRKVNSRVGGTRYSAHLANYSQAAADIKSSKMSPKQLFKWIATKSELAFDQIILYPTFVHVGYRWGERTCRGQIFKRVRYRGKTSYLSVSAQTVARW